MQNFVFAGVNAKPTSCISSKNQNNRNFADLLKYGKLENGTTENL